MRRIFGFPTIPRPLRPLSSARKIPGSAPRHLPDRVRSDRLVWLLRENVAGQIPGALAGPGIHHGSYARLVHLYCPDRRFHLLDTFEGFAVSDPKAESLAVGFNEKLSFPATSVGRGRQNIQPIGDPLAFEPG